jgi:hypothetical protein
MGTVLLAFPKKRLVQDKANEPTNKNRAYLSH